MQTQLIFCVHKQKNLCPKYLASHLILSFRNLGARNPIPKQEKNPVLGTLFFFLGSHPGKFHLPPTKSLLKV